MRLLRAPQEQSLITGRASCRQGIQLLRLKERLCNSRSIAFGRLNVNAYGRIGNRYRHIAFGVAEAYMLATFCKKGFAVALINYIIALVWSILQQDTHSKPLALPAYRLEPSLCFGKQRTIVGKHNRQLLATLLYVPKKHLGITKGFQFLKINLWHISQNGILYATKLYFLGLLPTKKNKKTVIKCFYRATNKTAIYRATVFFEKKISFFTIRQKFQIHFSFVYNFCIVNEANIGCSRCENKYTFSHSLALSLLRK